MASRTKGRFNGEVSAEYRRNANRIAAAGIKSHAADWGIKGTLLYASKAFKGRCYAGYRRADTPMQANSLLDVGFSAEYRIKNIGINARKKLEQFSGKKIFLKLEVIVKKGWSKNKKSLKEIGYDF